MPSFNKIILVGYLGRDPELRYTPQGTAICKFSIATSEKRKHNDGEAEESTTWFRCTAWGRQGELAQEYLSKGSQAYVEGQLREEKYTDREGQTRSSLEVNVREIYFLSTRGEQSQKEDEEPAPKGREDKRATVNRALGGTNKQLGTKSRSDATRAEQAVEDDEIPF